MVKDCSLVQSCISKPSSTLTPEQKDKDRGIHIARPEKRQFNKRQVGKSNNLGLIVFLWRDHYKSFHSSVSAGASVYGGQLRGKPLSFFRSERGQRSFRKQEEAKLLFSCRSGLEGRAVGVKAIGSINQYNRINQSVLVNRLTRRADSGPQSKLLLVDRGQRKGSDCFKSINYHARDTRLQATSYSVQSQRWE